MSDELNDHSTEDKALQREVLNMGGADPEHLDESTPQSVFDDAWKDGDTVTPDGYLT